jgi:hypothetical protein
MQKKLFCTAAFFLCVYCLSTSAKTVEKLTHFSVQNNFSDSVLIHSHTTKKDYVRLYPNPTSDGKVTINSISSESLHFYVFDLESTLIHRIELKGKEQKTINDLKKGTYMYDVFLNDESIEQGKIIVK